MSEKNVTHPVSVVIPYNKNETGLAVLLATLQAQLIPPQKIVIIDTSLNHSGLSIARRYYTDSGVDIRVEYAKNCPIYEAWNRGIELSGDIDVIVINDDVLLPMNFVDIMCTTAKSLNAYCFVPATPGRDHYKKYVDNSFNWYSAAPNKTDISFADWMPGFVFMLTKKAIHDIGKFDTKFKVWYGDDDYQNRLLEGSKKTKTLSIIKINSTFVYHYGGMSYKYSNNPELLKQIDLDKKCYITKWEKKIKK